MNYFNSIFSISTRDVNIDSQSKNSKYRKKYDLRYVLNHICVLGYTTKIYSPKRVTQVRSYGSRVSSKPQ